MNKHRLPLLLLAPLLFAACDKPPRITSPAAAVAVQDEDFKYQIVAENKPTSFGAVVPPGLGLTFEATTGLVSGKPAKFGEFALTASAKNAVGEASQVVSLSVSPKPHAVKSELELFIVDHRVLQRPDLAGPGKAWEFRSVLQRLSGASSAAELEAFAQNWFKEWETNTALNGDTFAARPRTAQALKSAWQTGAFRLIAVVNRLDLTRFQDHDPAKPVTKMGEGRFVFEVLNAPNGSPLEFTIILEYGLPHGGSDLTKQTELWAKRWHALGRPGIGDPAGPGWPTPAYVDELAAIAADFSATGANLNQLRTDELVDGPWELREFKLLGGKLKQVPVAQTPRDSLRGKPELAQFIADNAMQIVEGTHEVPPNLLGGVSDSQTKGPWGDTQLSRPTFIVSFNTCSGCHNIDLPSTGFQHVQNAGPGRSATLSPFLRDTLSLAHALPGASTNQHNEMQVRRDLLAAFAKDAPSQWRVEQTKSLVAGRASRKH